MSFPSMVESAFRVSCGLAFCFRSTSFPEEGAGEPACPPQPVLMLVLARPIHLFTPSHFSSV